MKWSIALAALALLVPASAHADDPCATNEAFESSLCRADRPMPEVRATPAAPRVGAPVTLTASSPGRGSTLAWDLDGDGAFDDASGATVTITAAPVSVVAVRETDQFGRTGADTVRVLGHTFNAAPSGQLTVTPAAPRVGKPVTVKAEGSDLDGHIAKVELDADGDGSFETVGDTRTLTFPAAGVRTLRARFTDDGGAVSTTTATLEVHAENLPPSVAVQVAADTNTFTVGAPVVAGPAVITLYGGDPDGSVAGYDLDLDGDGTYETHADPQDGPIGTRVKTTFAAGEHEIGVRVTDSDGATASARRSLLAVPAWPINGPHAPAVELDYAGQIVRPGAPVRLLATNLEPGASYTWDADGDGDFDDGSGQQLTFTYATPGERTVRVKAHNADGDRVAMATLSVREAPALAPVVSLEMPGTVRAGATTLFYPTVRAADGGTTSAALTYDLDGDGDFDDVPGSMFDYVTATFNAPVTIAVKATDGARTAVRTVDVAPISGNLGPVAHWMVLPSFSVQDPPGWLAGRALQLSADQGGTSVADCCTWAWQLDGVTRNLVESTTYAAGEHTISLRETAGDGTFAEERRTFTVGTLPPVGGFSAADSTLTSTSTDPEGGPVTIAWDLDGDRAFDDATGPTARALPGEHLVGVAATDAGGDVGITYATATGGPLPLPQMICSCAPPPSGRALQLTTTIKTPSRRTLLANGLTVRIHCSRACRTTGVAKLGKKVIARGSASGPTLRLKLTTAGRKAIKHLRRFKLRVEVTAEGVKSVRTVNVRR